MLKKSKILVFLFGMFNILHAQTSFQKTFGSSDKYDIGEAVIELPDTKEYLILGRARLVDTGNYYDAYLIKTDSTGSVLWNKIYGNSEDEFSNSIKYSKFDTSLFIIGTTHSFGYSDIFVQKVNLDGDTIWAKRYGGDGQDVVDYASCTFLCSDGGLIITGKGSVSGSGLYIMKLDSNGDTIWVKQNTNSYDRGESVIETNDGYMVSSLASTYPLSGLGVYLVKLNINGDTLWTRVYHKDNSDMLIGKAIQTTDLGYITCGYRSIFTPDYNFDIFVFKTDSVGDTLWTKHYGGDKMDYAYDIEATSDGGFIITGETTSFGFGSWDVYLLKIDSIGNIQWMKTYGGTGADYNSNVTLTSDGGFVLAGYTKSFGGNGEIYFIKTDSLGYSGDCNEMDVTSQVKTRYTPLGIYTADSSSRTFISGGFVNNITVNISSGGTDSSLCVVGVEELENMENNVLVYPNPASTYINLEWEFPLTNGTGTLSLYNFLGDEVMRHSIQQANSKFSFNTSRLQNGLYFYILKMEGEKGISGKVIIER